MKLSLIEVEGFRGIRAHLKINVPQGFLIVTGRNGSGKSTICDAVEFALTGIISKYDDSKERGESTEQYIWWRGRRAAAANFVRLGMRDEAGNEILITRTPTSVTLSGASELEGTLCDRSVISRDPLIQLCRTSIIRDESIAALSIDLAETDRFTFVRSALGTDALDEVTERGKAVLQTMRKSVEAARGSYGKVREEVTTLLAQLAQARSVVAEQPDTAAAETTVRRLLSDELGDAVRLLPAARQSLARWRQRAESLARVARELTLARQSLEEMDKATSIDVMRALETRKQVLAQERIDLAGEVQRLRNVLGQNDQASPMRARLANLYEAGRAIGRLENACPLCGTTLKEQAFRIALEGLKESIASAERDEAALRGRLSDSTARLDAIDKELASIETERRRRDAHRSELSGRIDALVSEGANLVPSERVAADVEVLLDEARQIQANGAELLQAIEILDASAGLERVADLERQVGEVRERASALEAELVSLEAAEGRAKQMLAGIRRSVGEIVEDKLAALDPLLKDLYSRLRPHNDWTDLSYNVRGELRKYLSLRVGEDINPRFTFSSGQRRAIGLAFLLAVHLSRPWCRLHSLVLDDPVQHIDDFRSLHLVEVLGAMRKAGQQIVCAVEDEGLAELMCRRIRQGSDGEGWLIKMAYRAGDGASLESATPVSAPTKHLVLSA
jgi:DNA repair exonuclease SbcCD ATPase subunit